MQGSLAKTSRPAAGDPALLDGVVERLLVDDAATGGVDEHEARLDLRQLLLADHAERLGRLRQVDGDEVGLFEQLVESDQLDAHLGRTAGLDVGVVGDDLHAEGAEPLSDEDADAAQADDADGLLVELDAGVLAALPLAVLQRGVGRSDVARGGQHERHGELRGGDDVGGRGVHDHHAGLGGRLDVDVVEADTGAGDHLQLLGGGEGLGVDLGRAAHQDGVDVGDGGQEFGAVGAVAVADLEVGSERLHGGGAELFCDENDGLAHGWSSGGCRRMWLARPASAGRPCTTLCPRQTLPDHRSRSDPVQGRSECGLGHVQIDTMIATISTPTKW